MNEVSNQFTILLFHINIDKQKAKHRVCRWADCWVPIGEGAYSVEACFEEGRALHVKEDMAIGFNQWNTIGDLSEMGKVFANVFVEVRVATGSNPAAVKGSLFHRTGNKDGPTRSHVSRLVEVESSKAGIGFAFR